MHVPLHALVYGGDKIDSRSKHTRGTDIDSLANSISRLGLILPLAVIQEGEKYRVVDGNRRLEALKKIHKGEKDAPVPVLVQDSDNGLAKMQSLAANVERLPLHPVDQYECFAALADGGLPLDEIAASFGISERQVRQQMALGSLARQVRQYYRDGKIDMRLAKSLTRVSVDKQLALVGNGSFSAWQVQQKIDEMLRTDSIAASSGLAHFVTRETYAAAGGTFVADLFVEEADEAWADPELANQLAEAKVDGLRKQSEADGWSFFERHDGKDWWGSEFMTEEPAGEPLGMSDSEAAAIATIQDRMTKIDFELDRQDDDLHPQHNELVGEYQDLEKKQNEILDPYRTYTDEQKARLGVVLSSSWEIHEGCARRAGATPKQAVEADVANKPEPGLSSAVTMELDAHLTVACKAALAADPALAVRLLALQLLQKSGLFGLDAVHGGITISQLGGDSVLKQPDHRLDEIEGLLKAVKLSRAKNFEGRVKAMEKIDDAGIALILAFFTARSLAGQHRGRDLVLLLDGRRQLDIDAYFTPDVDNFFGRLTKAQLVMCLDDMGLSKTYKNNNWDTLKKAELAAMVAQAKPEGWLPEAMRPKKPE